MLFINRLLSRLIYLIALLFFRFNLWEVKTKYFIVLEKHSKVLFQETNNDILKMLVLSEDRKFFHHLGIDIFGIIRAFYFNFRGTLQGASTITQQYIRALTNYNEICAKRKIIEIFLALLLNNKIDKITVARNYLTIAYFGHDMVGVNDALRKLILYNDSEIMNTAGLIARLKYPQNKYRDFENEYKINTRKTYLYELFIGKRRLSNSFYWKKNSYFPDYIKTDN